MPSSIHEMTAAQRTRLDADYMAAICAAADAIPDARSRRYRARVAALAVRRSH